MDKKVMQLALHYFLMLLVEEQFHISGVYAAEGQSFFEFGRENIRTNLEGKLFHKNWQIAELDTNAFSGTAVYLDHLLIHQDIFWIVGSVETAILKNYISTKLTICKK